MDRFSEYRIMWVLVLFDLPTDTTVSYTHLTACRVGVLLIFPLFVVLLFGGMNTKIQRHRDSFQDVYKRQRKHRILFRSAPASGYDRDGYGRIYRPAAFLHEQGERQDLSLIHI